MNSLIAVSARRWFLATAILFLAAVDGCSATIGDASKSSGNGPNGSSTANGGGTIVDPTTGKVIECDGNQVTNAKRLIRLSFNQIANSLGSLLGSAVRDQIVTDYQVPDPTTRWFPPLSNPREGSVIIDSQWQETDAIAQAAGKYVLDNFASVTKCPSPATDACAQQFVTTFAQKAFRRPLAAEEQARLLKVYSDTKAAGGTVNESVQYSVYAALQSPLFLYRTEFGGNSAVDGPLTPYEMASQLSLFLSDGPPDQPLLDAAAQNKLSDPTDIKSQAARLLATTGVQQNLEAAMLAYFALPNVLSVVIDPMIAPTFTPGLANSMYHESELFMKGVLWNGKVSDLLTSRRAVINQSLADLYGVSFPPPGAALDADKFALTELPTNRSGILTQAAFLTSKARPNVPSVVGRGLTVNKSVVCQINPAFPDNLKTQIDAVNTTLADKTEREKAEYRAGNSPCNGCHPHFDPFGLALQNYDILGKFTTADPEGRPIDPSVTLPDAAGGGAARDAVDMAKKLADSGSFEVCMSKNLLLYAMAEGTNLTADSCSTQAIAASFNASGRTFGELVQEIAVSKGFTTRTAGAAQ
jgi:hypothetical protein